MPALDNRGVRDDSRGSILIARSPSQHNPAHVHEESHERRFTTIMHFSGAVDIKTRMSEMRGAARRALDGARARVVDAASDRAMPTTGAITLSRAHNPLRHGKFAAMIPGDSAVEVVITSGIFSTLNIYNTLLIGRLILTWFPNPPRQIVYPLATLCDPYLNLFRGIIPPIGGTIDLSPILAFTVLNVFTNTAAALPCEIDPETGEMKAPEKPRGIGAKFRERVELARARRAAKAAKAQ